jgi:RNA polymerase sigma factor (sigma-70 family)
VELGGVCAEPGGVRAVAADLPISDAELVRAALAGDRDALGSLVLRHWPTAVVLAARVLGSRELASDAVQEAAIAAMTGLDRLRSPDRFGAWFCGITLHVSRRWLRQLRYELPAVEADPTCLEPGPAEVAELADIAARVRAAIALLADGQAEAVRLFYLQGLSHREVAAELGISPGAVKARLHQARAALAPRLAEVIDIAERKPMSATDNDAGNGSRWVDSQIAEIRLTPGKDDQPGHYVMIIAETGGGRQLPIWIGPAEATALAMALESAETPRPLTYKLAASLVSAAGAGISEVRITRLEPPVFYAAVVVNGANGLREVDARPSDAVNLALTAGVPIRVDVALFDHELRPEWAGDLAASSVVTTDLVAELYKRFADAAREFRCGGAPADDGPG